VVIETIDNEVLQGWIGDYGYWFRIKIKAIEHIANKWPEDNLLFVDTDTFLYGELGEIKLLLEKGDGVMHLNEGKLSEKGSKTEKTMWRELKGKELLGIKIDPNTCMWNSGTIGIPKFILQDSIAKSLAFLDEMSKIVSRRKILEQLAFNLSLSSLTQLHPSDHIIGHYWGNKIEWNQFINSFFIDCHLRHLSVENQIAEIKKMDLSIIPYYVKTSNTKIRLQKLLNSWFPEKNKRYLNGMTVGLVP
jgi:hypothetical protein